MNLHLGSSRFRVNTVWRTTLVPMSSEDDSSRRQQISYPTEAG